MTIIKTGTEYRGISPLTVIEYDKNDYKLLTERLSNQLSADSINRIVDYLDKTNEVITIHETYDCQSGWRGADVILSGVNLSGNGYCLSDNSVFSFFKISEAK